MKVKIINKSNNPLPRYATNGAAGFDLQANIDSENVICIEPNERKKIPTGLYFEIPIGYKMSIIPRSGKSFEGIVVANSPGLVDSDYRGEVKVILQNSSIEKIYIKHGDRIAQGVIEKFEQVEFELVETLSETARGAGGFGSTDLKTIEPEIKVGTVLIAKDACKGFYSKTTNKPQNALIVGKEYKVIGINTTTDDLVIISEIGNFHGFGINKDDAGYFGEYFDIVK